MDKLELYRNNVEHSLRENGDHISNVSIQIDKLKNRFEEGDYIHIYNYNRYSRGYRRSRSSEDKLIPNCYRGFSNEDPITVPIKYKVSYVDSKGFPHVQTLDEHGNLDNYPSSLSEALYHNIRNGDLDNGFDIDEIYQLDPEFADATILGEDYDPLYKIKEARKATEAKEKEDAELWYKIHEINKAFRCHTRAARNRNAFKRRLKVGDTIWAEHGGELTLKFKDFDEDMFVFKNIKDKLIALNSNDFKEMIIYRERPKAKPQVHYDVLQKYKPKRTKKTSDSKTESK